MPRVQDHELYRRILGIEAPWFVESVDLRLEAGEIHVYLRHDDLIEWPCPECGAACKLYDISRNGSGGIWTRASIRRSCTPRRRAANAVIMA
jgi:hypothetical protein